MTTRQRGRAFIERTRPGILTTPTNSSSGTSRPGCSEDPYKFLASLRSHHCDTVNHARKVQSAVRRTKVGWAETQGRRVSMEDQIVIVGHEDYDLLGVFDGHNGSDTSVWAGNHIGRYFQLSLDTDLGPEEALVEAFKETNESLRQNNILGGTTALVVVIMENKIIVANAGDCRMVAWKDGDVHRITRDHKPNDEIEKARIEEQGGEVTSTELPNGTTMYRVNGILGVARAMGDFSLEPHITCVPDIFQVSTMKEDEYIVIACDGLWDVLQDVEVAQICGAYWKDKKDTEDVEGAACRLRNVAYSRNSTDNISVVVIRPWCTLA